MDELADDADNLFVLTRIRPDLLEPPLASRHGRMDQAIEIPTPDEDCRHRLFALCGRESSLQVADLSRFIARTDGASPEFIREPLRSVALIAADEDQGTELVAADRHLDKVVHELVLRRGDLTKSLLGFHSRIGFGSIPRSEAPE
jgi:ATP-dependent 26S proteasome regulatory subunit